MKQNYFSNYLALEAGVIQSWIAAVIRRKMPSVMFINLAVEQIGEKFNRSRILLGYNLINVLIDQV